jgi:hypothetical protein
MDYAIERDGGGTRILLENGDRILIKVIVGNIKPNGKHSDGTPQYQVQTNVAMFVEAAEPAAMKTVSK